MPKFYFILLFSLSFISGFGQIRNVHYGLEGQGIVTTSGQVPFWLRSNQFGSVPLSGPSVSFISRLRKDYDSTQTKLFDWGVGYEGRVNVGKTSQFLLVEGYGKARLGIFELKAGRAKEIMGLVDTTLSSGAFAISGNALGIPKVQLAIPGFYTLPIFKGMFAFKGNFAHGWVGQLPLGIYNIGSTKRVDQDYVYFHQKSLYGKFGRNEWKIRIYGGFNHQVFWGDYRRIYAPGHFNLTPLQAYFYVITGKAYGAEDGARYIERSKLGNQLGSIDLGLEYDMQDIKVFAYRQSFYDVGALYYLANIMDGLNGISLINKKNSDKIVQWRKVVLELLYTKNQAGETWSKITPSGDEDYYNNYFYSTGWSYKGLGIGTPFLSTKASTRKNLPSDPVDYFNNNRVLAFHVGLQGQVKAWRFVAKSSYSKNYGTFGTSISGRSRGKLRFPPQNGIFPEVNQFSAYLEGSRDLTRGYSISFLTAFDSGKLLYDTGGLIVKFSKKW
ncbi:capsule assembly Wzi family protein [Adhaeribacter aquaticus]|uniref:capsule assembly Wzi family protein n=1 Tax=Adhaeribacter aquaticus TaxID=299567 RepID=UPI0004104C6A|nr:capsule assembly Wzi family protein [Adhaeribacter aquaticus]